MVAGPIGNSRPEARQATRSSCQEDFEPMVQCYHGSPLHLLHIVAMILTRVQDDDVTTIDAIEMVDEEDVEAERVVAMSTHGKKVLPIRSYNDCSFKTFVRPAKVPPLNFKTLVTFLHELRLLVKIEDLNLPESGVSFDS
jgi:hypothetical protein